MKEGLKPRKETGISNWYPPWESHPDFVYLASMKDAMAVGGVFTEWINDKGHQVIIEVEVDTKNLYPDTDYALETWYKSLIQGCGAAYKGRIHPKKILRVWGRIGFPNKTSYKLIIDNTKNRKL